MRQRLMAEHRSGGYTNAELATGYRVTEHVLYATRKRYADAQSLDEFRDRPKAPKNPHRVHSEEDVRRLYELRRSDEERIRKNGGTSVEPWTPAVIAWRLRNWPAS